MNTNMFSKKLIFILLSIFILEGCLFTRLNDLKGQFCNFENFFTIKGEDNFEFLFAKSLLLKNDIMKIVGFSPLKEDKEGGNERLDFQFIKSKDIINDKIKPAVKDKIKPAVKDKIKPGAKDKIKPGAKKTLLSFYFNQKEKNMKLNKVSLNQNILDIFPKKLFMDLAKTACFTHAKTFERSMNINFADVDLKNMPDKKKIENIFGLPDNYSVEQKGDFKEFSRYTLFPISDGKPVKGQPVIISLSYNKEDGKLSKFLFDYYSYMLDIDFEARELNLKLKKGYLKFLL